MDKLAPCANNAVQYGSGPQTKVGIFWSVDGVIVGDAVWLQEAEAYGDALQYGGHYEYWGNLRAGNEAERKLKQHAYDYYPRGRMVFFLKRQTVRLYVDRCMNNDVTGHALDFFAQQGYEVEIEQDEHYRCAGCNPFFME